MRSVRSSASSCRRQQLLPAGRGVAAGRVEVERVGGGEVGARAGLVHRGQRHAGLQLTARQVARGAEVQQVAWRLLARPCMQHRGAHDGAAEAQHEGGLALDPVLRLHAAADLAATFVELRARRQHARTVDEVQAVLEVHQHLHRAVAAEAPAVQGHTRRGGELHAHAVRRQRDGVEARPRALAGLVVRGREVGRARRPARTGRRHQQHVAQLGDAGAADVRVREAQRAPGAPLVAAAVAPAAVGVVGAGHHHAEGHGRGRRDVAGAVGADEGVDPARHRRRGRRLAEGRAGQRRGGGREHRGDHHESTSPQWLAETPAGCAAQAGPRCGEDRSCRHRSPACKGKCRATARSESARWRCQ